MVTSESQDRIILLTRIAHLAPGRIVGKALLYGLTTPAEANTYRNLVEHDAWFEKIGERFAKGLWSKTPRSDVQQEILNLLNLYKEARGHGLSCGLC